MEKLIGEKPVRIFTDYKLRDVARLLVENPDKEYMVTARNDNTVWGIMNASGVIFAQNSDVDPDQKIESLLYYYRKPLVIKNTEPYEKIEKRARENAKAYRSLFVNKTGIPQSDFKDFVSEIRWIEVLKLLANRNLKISKKV